MKFYTIVFRLFISSVLLFVIISCAGDGSTLDPFGNPLGPPKVSVTPDKLNVEVDKGQVVSFNLKIKNVGGFPLQITKIQSGVEWIQLGEISLPVELKASDSLLVPITLGKASLDANTYTGSISISSNDEDTPKLEINVTLKVTEEVLIFEPTLSKIQSFIFSPVCTECHAGAGAPRGLLLSEGNSYSHLVGVKSDEKPELFLVEPFNPDNSYLIKKLEGASDIFGGRMPLNRPPLTKEQIKVVRRWIANGALDN